MYIKLFHGVTCLKCSQQKESRKRYGFFVIKSILKIKRKLGGKVYKVLKWSVTFATTEFTTTGTKLTAVHRRSC